jgi:membrane protein CcdC involved in cytochrome C biogenesis
MKMANSVKTYQKLPGSKKGFLIGKHTLWQGKDHLLYIFSRFGAEDYKRFYFNDVQAIITRKTIVGKIQNIVLGCFILMFLVPVFFFDGGWSIFYAVVCGMMFLFLLINFYKGPTCETRLLTAVQTERLHSLSRLKIACRVMDRLRPFIQRAQGTLKPEGLNKIPVRPAERKAHNISGATSARSETGRVHMILFGLLLFDGVLAVMEFFITHMVPTVLGSIAGLCLAICVILALVKQHHSNLPASLRAITWTCLGFVCVNFAVGYVIGIGFAMRNPRIAYNQWEVFKFISSLSPWDSPLMMSLNIMAICGALFLGIPGLIILLRSEKKVKKPATERSSIFGPQAISRNAETS